MMKALPETALYTEAEREALIASRSYGLPFGRQSWRGSQGSSQGQGVGNSIDFHDHRAYQYGDDPRYIHWSAYARTGQYVMKLFRAEQSPLVEIAVDISPSMALSSDKLKTTEALLKFCIQASDRVAAPLRIHAVDGEEPLLISVQEARHGGWRERLKPAGGKTIMPARIPWRPQSMRIFITDLLYPGDPLPLLGAMGAASGIAMIFAPWDAAEENWVVRGNVQLEDCESGEIVQRRVTDEWSRRFSVAYRKHFDLWNEVCVRYNVGLARVSSGMELKNALAVDALRAGLVELL